MASRAYTVDDCRHYSEARGGRCVSAAGVVQQFESIGDFAAAASRMAVPWSIRTGPGNFRAAIAQEPFADSLFGELRYDPCSGVRDREEIARSPEDYVCLTIYEEGAMRMIQHGRTIDAKAGDFMLWDASTPSSFECLAPTRCKLIWLPQRVFRRHGASFDALADQVIPASSTVATLVGHHLRQLHQLVAAFHDRQKSQVFEASIEFILSCLPDQHATADLTRQQEILVARARREIEARMSKGSDITPAAIADALGISVRYLHRLFALTGQSLLEYAKAQRLERARRMLARGDCRMNIAEIAQDVGFYDSSHFNKAFKRRFGVAPSRYRPG